MTEPRLSSTQRAYLFQREKFLEGLAQRAETLFEDGYAVWPTGALYVFAVTRESKQGEVAYLVNPVAHTCTCSFYTRQEQGERLTDDGSLVPCKHQRGLRKLIRQMAQLLKQEGDMPCYFRLRGHWLGVRSALRRQGEDDDSDTVEIHSATSTTSRKEKSEHDDVDAKRGPRPQPVGGA